MRITKEELAVFLSDREDEIWKDVVGFEGRYSVSNYGRVANTKPYTKRTMRNKKLKSNKRLDILIPDISRTYLHVKLYSNYRMKHFYLHRLVATAFIPNPENKSHINHIDCNKFNNYISNLEWCTHKENMEHSSKNGMVCNGEGRPNHVLTEEDVRSIRRESIPWVVTNSMLGDKYKVTPSLICMIVSKKRWKHVI